MPTFHCTTVRYGRSLSYTFSHGRTLNELRILYFIYSLFFKKNILLLVLCFVLFVFRLCAWLYTLPLDIFTTFFILDCYCQNCFCLAIPFKVKFWNTYSTKKSSLYDYKSYFYYQKPCQNTPVEDLRIQRSTIVSYFNFGVHWSRPFSEV